MCMNLRRAIWCWLSWTGQDWVGKLSGGWVKAEDAPKEFWALLRFREEAASLLIPRSHVKPAFSVMADCAPWAVALQAPLSTGFFRKNTGVGCHFLLQGIFLTQRSNPCLLHWHVSSLPLSHLRSPLHMKAARLRGLCVPAVSVRLGSEQDSLLEPCTCQVQRQEVTG